MLRNAKLFKLPEASSIMVTWLRSTFTISGQFWPASVSSLIMDEGNVGRVSNLLSEASGLLCSSSSTTSNPAVNSSRSAAIPQATINETLRRAEGKYIHRPL